jgi:probable O-glycosylation ligase (exosortase A-associated)
VRDLMMLGAFALMVPMTFVNAFCAYLLWEWTAVLSPAYYLYGFMQSVRFNLIFAITSIGLLLLGRVTERGKFRFTPAIAVLTLFLLHACLSAAFAYDNNLLNAEVFSGLVKSLVFCVLMPVFVTTRLRIHAMLVMLSLGLGFHGTVEGFKVLVTAGAHKPVGVATSMMSDNNHFAVALVMIVPILFYLFRYTQRRLVRIGFLGVFALAVIAVVGTQSRGGFVALALTGLWLIFSSRHKLLAIFAVACMAGLVAVAAPSSWFERMESIQSAKSDDSFLGRVAAWRISTAIALENPLLGGGFHAVQVQRIWEMHRPSAMRLGVLPQVDDMPENPKAAHSIYFEMLGDQGFLGLAIFLCFFAVSFYNIQSTRRLARRHPRELAWGADLASMLGVSILAYSVGGALVSLAYFETFYVMVLLTDVLKRVVQSDVARLEGPRSRLANARRSAGAEPGAAQALREPRGQS